MDRGEGRGGDGRGKEFGLTIYMYICNINSQNYIKFGPPKGEYKLDKSKKIFIKKMKKKKKKKTKQK